MRVKFLKVILIISTLFIASCFQSTQTDLLGKWDLVTESKTHGATLTFNELQYKSETFPNYSNSSSGDWWINNNNIYMSYNWIGGKDTMGFKILRLNKNELHMLKISGALLEEKPDTVRFIRQ